MNKRTICIAAFIILAPVFAMSQSGNRMQLSIQPESKLWLEGTSTMHDYSSKTSRLTGMIIVDSLLLAGEKGSSSKLFHQVDVTIPVKTLLSGDEKLDENLYDVLNADDHPEIVYRMVSDSIIPGEGKDSLAIRTTGILAVAGKEKAIGVIASLVDNRDGTYSIKGHKELLMTDFGIDPPSMMLGLLKTDDKIVIRFELMVRPQTYVQR